MKRTCLVAVGLALLAAAPVSARDLPSETPDDVAWVDSTIDLIGTNGARTLLGGDFVNMGERAGRGAIVSAVSGEARTVVEDVGEIDTVIADRAGGWYVGGRGHVDRLRADGSTAFSITIGDLGLVSALALSPDGETLYVGGYFGSVDGQPRTNIAAVDADDGRLLAWAPQSFNRVWALAVAPDGARVFAAGTAYDGSQFRALTVLDAATGAVIGYVGRETGTAVSFSPDGRTAYFTFVDNQDGVIAIDAATLAERWRASVGSATDLAVTPDGRYLYITQAPRDGIVRQLDAATGVRTSWSTPLTAASDIELSPDGETAYVGRADATGWGPAGAVAFATRDGALLAWSPGTRNRHSVDALAVSPDGSEVFIDSASGLNTRARPQAALLDETGRPTSWLDPSFDHNTALGDVELDSRSTAYFTRYSTFASFRDDSIWAVAADSTVRWHHALDGAAGLALSRDQETVYLTGSFTQIGGVPRAGVAALRASDGAVLPWTLSVTGGAAYSQAFSLDGRTLYLGGTFTAVNGVPRRGLAAVDVATGAVLGFAPELDGRVSNVKLSPDGTVLFVSGQFGDHEERRYLLGLRVSDGTVVFDPPLGWPARSFVILGDGQTVMVASQFSQHMIGARPLTAWDVQSSSLLPWRAVGCVSCDVNILALDPDGRTLHVGGDFEWGGRIHYYMRLGVDRGPSAPANTTPPRVLGTAQPGRFVECEPGTWSGHPERYRFAWTLDGAVVAGFGRRELLLTSADAGRAVACEVRAGVAVAASAPVTVGSDPPPWTPEPRRTAAEATPQPTPTPTVTPAPTATPEPTATAAPQPTATPDADRARREPDVHAPIVTAPLAGGPLTAAPLPDRVGPRVTIRRAKLPLRLSVSEPVTVTAKLRGITRTVKLNAGTHTLSARRLTGRAHPRGRLTLRIRDAAGNAARVLRFRM